MGQSRPPLQLSAAALDELFAASPAGEHPRGRGAGTAIVFPATPFASAVAALARLLWKGKAFDSDRPEMVNLLSPLALSAVRAEVYEAASRRDGKPCLVLDYSGSSRLARWIRDEIRQVGPAEYLGLVFVKGRRMPIRFFLSFAEAS